MNKEIILSIVVPIYNVEKYLEQCVLSLVSQTLSSFEIILVDDGSTDYCPTMCDDFCKHYNNIIVIHKKNGGLSDARNAGIDVARGEWIAFVDSDDFVENTMFEKLYHLAVSNHKKIAMADFQWVDENGMKIDGDDEPEFLNGCVSEKQIYQKLMTTYAGHYIIAWNKIYHRSLWKQRRFPVGKINEDQFIMHEIFYEAKEVACTKEKLYCYRKVCGSIMNRNFSVKRLDDIEGLQKRFRFYQENGLYGRLYLTERMIFNKIKQGMKKLEPNEDNRDRVIWLLKQQKDCYEHVQNKHSYSICEKIERLFAFKLPILYWNIVRR